VALGSDMGGAAKVYFVKCDNSEGSMVKCGSALSPLLATLTDQNAVSPLLATLTEIPPGVGVRVFSKIN
jgi:hypothetical protein